MLYIIFQHLSHTNRQIVTKRGDKTDSGKKTNPFHLDVVPDLDQSGYRLDPFPGSGIPGNFGLFTAAAPRFVSLSRTQFNLLCIRQRSPLLAAIVIVSEQRTVIIHQMFIKRLTLAASSYGSATKLQAVKQPCNFWKFIGDQADKLLLSKSEIINSRRRCVFTIQCTSADDSNQPLTNDIILLQCIRHRTTKYNKLLPFATICKVTLTPLHVYLYDEHQHAQL